MYLIVKVLWLLMASSDAIADNFSNGLNTSEEGCCCGQRYISCESTEPPRVLNRPRFRTPKAQEIVASKAMWNVVIRCEVDNLGDYKLSLIRLRDNKTILGSKRDTHGLWEYFIRNHQVEDSGGYECQVRLEHMLSMGYWLKYFIKENFCGINNVTNHEKRNPYFVNITQQKVTSLEGGSAYLDCGVNDFHRYGLKWIRKRDGLELTADDTVCTMDLKYEAAVMMAAGVGASIYRLKINSPQLNDSGMYQCQINTEPKMFMEFQLKVIGNEPANYYFSGGYWSEISDWPTINLRIGETDVTAQYLKHATLICSVNNFGTREISWIRVRDNMRICNTSEFKGELNTYCTMEPGTNDFLLVFRKATEEHSGTYQCQVIGFKPQVKKTFHLKICGDPVNNGTEDILCNSVLKSCRQPKHYLFLLLCLNILFARYLLLMQ